jgi:hypothetical protein
MLATAGEGIPADYQVRSQAQSVNTDPNYPLPTHQAGSGNNSAAQLLGSFL